MWLFPVEKLPPLVLGPLAMVAGVWELLQPETIAGQHPFRFAFAIASGLIGGACLTAYGVWRLVTQRAAPGSSESDSAKE
jgi:hypothetical protein